MMTEGERFPFRVGYKKFGPGGYLTTEYQGRNATPQLGILALLQGPCMWHHPPPFPGEAPQLHCAHVLRSEIGFGTNPERTLTYLFYLPIADQPE